VAQLGARPSVGVSRKARLFCRGTRDAGDTPVRLKRVMSNGRALLAWTVAALWPAPEALAAAPPSSGPHLSWTAPDGCPTEATVRAAVDAMVGTPRSQGRGSDVSAAGVVTGDPGRFMLESRVEIGGLAEAKTVTAESCATLADAYAVIVAFAVDPSAGARLPPPLPPRLDNEPSAVRPADRASKGNAHPTSLPISPRASGARGSPSVRIGPSIATEMGLLPGPAYGLGGRVSVDAGPRWELAATVWPERSSATATPPTSVFPYAGALVGLFTVEPSACAGFWRDAAAVCVGAEVGRMHATGTGLPTTRTGVSWWLAPTLSLAARVPLGGREGPVDLQVRLGIGVPVFRPSFVLDQVGPGGSVEVYRPLPAFGLVSIEPELRAFSHGLHP
jgi:hypothetical protein